MILMSVSLSCSNIQANEFNDSAFLPIDMNDIKLNNPYTYIELSPVEKNIIQIKSQKNISSIIPKSTPKLEKNIEINTSIKKDLFAPFSVQPIQEENLKEQMFNQYDVVVEEKHINNDVKVDFNGYTIGEIVFEGLNTINADYIASSITTKVGNLYNFEILQQDLQQIYETGYFTDKIEIEPELKSDNTVLIKFLLKENILVNGLCIVGNTVISENELLSFLKPLENMPQNVRRINEAIEQINNYYHSKGYILATIDNVTDDEDGNLIFSINEGKINKIFFEGNEKTKDYVIERNIMTVAGSVYNEEYLKRDIAKLYSTSIFKEVDRNIYPSSEVDGTYDVKIVLKEGPQNTFGIGGGIDNAIGAFGSLSYTENNFLGRGQKLSLSGILGSGILMSDASIKNRINYQLELNFVEPHFLNADNSLMSKFYFRELGSYQIPLAIERRIGFKTGIEHRVRGYKNLTTNFTTGIEHISLKEGDFNKISSLYDKRGLDIKNRSKELTGGLFLNFAPGVKYSTIDNEYNPRSGIIAQAKYVEAFSVDNFSHTNGRLMGSISKYFPVGKKSSFSLTGRGGMKVHGDNMPEVLAFRLGGPYSLRGFRMSGVGTGESFLMGSAELATPLPFVDKLKWDFIKNMRITFFVDAGKVYNPTIASILYDRPLSAISAGIGLKIYIPNIGPVSVDYGIPLTNVGEFGSKGGYFTFGSNMYGTGW